MRIRILTVLAILLLCGVVSTAQAYPVLTSGENVFKFEDYEILVSTDADIDVDDLFIGILRTQEIQTTGGAEVWDDDNSAPSFDTLTGYFLTKVSAVDALNHIIDLTHADSDPFGVLTSGELTAGVVMKLWADSTYSVFESNGLPLSGGAGLADDIGKATDGTPWLSLTIDNGYWWTDGPANPPLPPAEVGTSWMGLNIYQNWTGLQFLTLNDPNESRMNLDVKMYAKAIINATNTHGEWMFESNDPAHMITPEPTSMLLFGIGTLGLAVLRRKKVA